MCYVLFISCNPHNNVSTYELYTIPFYKGGLERLRNVFKDPQLENKKSQNPNQGNQYCKALKHIVVPQGLSICLNMNEVVDRKIKIKYFVMNHMKTESKNKRPTF